MSVTIAPTTATVQTGKTQQFSATVTGSTNTAVTWSVDGTNGGSSASGTITTDGVYTAPAAAGTHTVTATSSADASKSATAQVTVTAAPTVAITITPTSATLNTGATQQFSAAVTNASDTTVAWSVDGVAGGNASVGTVSNTGLYTAPATAGSHKVTATSNADKTKSASATVTVNAPVVIVISISPTTASVAAGTTQAFTATVTGTTNTGVVWSVDNVQGGSGTTGLISDTGVYTAPSVAGKHTITVASIADTTKTASAIVTVTGSTVPVSVAITPTTATLAPGATQQFNATVSNATKDSTVTWAVDGSNGGSPDAGTISDSGLYTAPAAGGTHTVTATSNEDTTKSATATVTVNAPVITVTVTSPSNSVNVGSTLQFTASVTGSTNTAVTWSVDKITGGNATVGTITSSGLYTAPNTTGEHTVTATSVADTKQSGSATITVQQAAPPPANSGDVVVDFANRVGGSPIPSGLFGSQLGGMTDPTALKKLASAGLSATRAYADVWAIFPTQTADWSTLDGTLGLVKNAGMKITLEVTYTPTWLQPATIPTICRKDPDGVHSKRTMPTDVNAWAALTAQIVAHVNQKFPGVVQYYEIWNEPDELTQFCGATDSDATDDQQRLDEYKQIYQAAAVAMKAQAKSDGASAVVGGPALGHYPSTYWVKQLVQLTNNGSQIVDFVSYHQYLAGQNEAQGINGSQVMTWDGAGGSPSLYNRTLAAGTGIAAVYHSISAAAQTGKFTVPVMLDEYNDDWFFGDDCCKNSPRYSPVWNTMVVSELLNAMYSGDAPLQHLSYYSAWNPKSFCLLGDTSTLNCTVAGTNAYPQFRAFELLASPSYLDLQSKGGNMASSIANSTAMDTAGLIRTAFYTPTSNGIVLVNPMGTDITNATVVIGNPGFSSPVATQYLLNETTYSPTAQIQGTSLSLASATNGVKATVTIPAYSVLVIKVSGQ